MDEVARTRVVVVDDHTLFVDALELALEHSGFEVVGPARLDLLDAGGDPVPALLDAEAHVAILDLDLGSAGDGARLIPSLVVAGVAVLVVTATDDVACWGRCLLLGADGVLLKTSPLEEIIEAVATLRAGRALVTGARREVLVRAWQVERDRRLAERSRFDTLTRREGEVLAELARGRRIGEIARSAVVAESTVRSQVKSILAKLGVGSQLAAVSLVHDHGWTAPGGT